MGPDVVAEYAARSALIDRAVGLFIRGTRVRTAYDEAAACSEDWPKGHKVPDPGQLPYHLCFECPTVRADARSTARQEGASGSRPDIA